MSPLHVRRHSFRDQIIANLAILANFLKLFVLTTYILGVYMTSVTTFEDKNILRESTFKAGKVKFSKIFFCQGGATAWLPFSDLLVILCLYNQIQPTLIWEMGKFETWKCFFFGK